MLKQLRSQRPVKRRNLPTQDSEGRPLDFVSEHWTPTDFNAVHVLCLPAMAHRAGDSLRFGEPAPATDYRVPERTA